MTLTDDVQRVTPPTTNHDRSITLASVVSRNFFALSSGQLAERLIAMITLAYLARTLDPECLGVVIYASALAGYAILAANSGLDVIGSRTVAQNVAEGSGCAGAIIAARACLSVLIYLIALLASPLFPWSLPLRSAILVASLAVFPSVIQLDWFYQAQDRMHVIAVRRALAQVTTLIAVLVLVRRQDAILQAALCPVIGVTVGSMWTFRSFLKEREWRWPSIDIKSYGRLLKSGLPVLLSSAMILTYQQCALIVLERYRPMSDVGIYGICQKIYITASALQVMANSSIYPTLCRIANGRSATKTTILWATTILMNRLGLILALALTLLAKPVLSVFFGHAIVSNANIVAVLAIALFLVFNECVTAPYLYANGRLNTHLAIVTLGALVNIGSTCLLVPKYGAVGCAWALVISEFCVFLGLYTSVRKAAPIPGAGLLFPTFAGVLLLSLLVEAEPGWPKAIIGTVLAIFTLSLFPTLKRSIHTLRSLRMSSTHSCTLVAEA